MEASEIGQWMWYKQQFLQHETEHVAQRAAVLMQTLYGLSEYDRKDRRGGVLVLVPDETCTSHIALAIGIVPDTNPEKYHQIAWKKCVTLRDHKESQSSYTFRNEAEEIYGGGIRFEAKWQRGFTLAPFGWVGIIPAYSATAYVAFSGLPEHGDEALILVLAIDMEWISEDQANAIARASSNPYFEALFKASR